MSATFITQLRHPNGDNHFHSGTSMRMTLFDVESSVEVLVEARRGDSFPCATSLTADIASYEDCGLVGSDRMLGRCYGSRMTVKPGVPSKTAS